MSDGWKRALREIGPWVALPPLLFVAGLVAVYLLTRGGGEMPFVYAAH